MDKANFTLYDFAHEAGKFLLNIPEISAGNFATTMSNLAAFETALEGITSGSVRRYAATHDVIVQQGFPEDEFSHRETKWLVTYIDTSPWLNPPTNTIANPGYSKVFNVEIPTADIGAVTFKEGSDHLVMDDSGVVAAFILAFEGVALSPFGGSPDVVDIQLVGRNL